MYVKNFINRCFEQIRCLFYRKKLENDFFTIISNNCLAGVMYHLLNKPFLSPTINLYFETADFVKFCSNLKYYLSSDVREYKCDKPFPVGIIKDDSGGVKIFFLHYANFEEAKKKWIERAKRVNFDNIIVTFTEHQLPLSLETILAFEKLPFSKKVFLSERRLEGIKSLFYQPIYMKSKHKVATDYISLFGKRNFMTNRFDFVRFINDGQYWNA